MKRLRIICLLVVCTVLLSGCNAFSGGQNVEELLSPPKITKEQAEIVNALEEAEGGSIQLQSPSGDNDLSSLIMADLDGDGRAEAVVFYIAPQKGKNVRVALLKQENNEYIVAFVEDGVSSEIERIAVANFHQGKGKQLVVGFQNPSLNEHYVIVYNCIDKEGNLALERVYEQSYSQFIACDLTGDRLEDLLVTSAPKEASDEGVLVTLLSTNNNELQTLATHRLNPKLTRCDRLSFSVGRPNNAVVIDGGLGMASSASIVLHYTNGALFGGELEEYTMLAGADFVEKTIRTGTVLQSIDIDEDGAVEVPSIIGAYRGEQNPNRFFEVVWYDIFQSLEQPDIVGLADLEYGYFLKMPQALQEIAAVTQSGGGRNFAVTDIQTGEEMFDIVLLSKGEKLTGNDEQFYTQVAASDGYRIYIRISRLPAEIDKGILLSGFIILR